MNITRRDVISYTVMPQIMPRLKELFSSGFNYIPYFIALVYNVVRLLPAQHPYLDPSNIGQFGIRHVVAEAANNLVISWRNTDQIILFSMVLIGLVMALIQICIVVLMLFMQPALAAMPVDFAGFFITSDPEQDIAHMMLDLVFGVPDMFNSCVAQRVPCMNAQNQPIEAISLSPWAFEGGAFPLPIHDGLHALFQLYSYGLLVVATFIAIYFMITVVAETMQSGTPFGKRYNKVWAPIRLVVAFGLLIPVGYGLNSAQYIVLYGAKFGSGFATNGWTIFNDVLNTAHGGAYASLVPAQDASSDDLLAAPKVPELSGLFQFLFVARTCYEAETIVHPITAGTSSTVAGHQPEIRPYIIGNAGATNPAMLLGEDFYRAIILSKYYDTFGRNECHENSFWSCAS